MSKKELSIKEIEQLRLARWRCRWDLGFLCREILNYQDVDDEVHGPVIETLQKFPKPTSETWVDHDFWDGRKWRYKPLVPMQNLQEGRRRLILDPRGHLKCVVSTSKINTYAGEYKNASDLRVGDTLWGIDDDDFTPRPTKVTGLEAQPPQRCYRVRFRSGRVVEISHNHPVRMIDGWVYTEDLSPGDRVAVLNNRPVTKSNSLGVSEAEFLGWMAGDGCCPLSSFTNGLSKFRERFSYLVEELGGNITPTRTTKKEVEVRFSGLRDLLREHDFLEARSGNKFVPKAVFTASDACVLRFLWAYLMCDGTLQKGSGVSWTSKSERLANDIRRLLGRFGIVARVLPVALKTGPYAGNTYYYGYVSGTKNVEKLLSIIPWDKAHSWTPATLSNPNIDTVPKEWRELYPKYFFPRGERPEWIKEKWNRKGKNCVSSQNKYGGKKEYLYDLGVALDDERLKNLGSDKIFWDEVTSVEFIGEFETIAIETETENFCVDDVITHNTTINAQAHTIQWIINYPEVAIAIWQSNSEKGELILKEIKHHFQFNEKFRQLFPELVPQRRPEDFGTKGEFTTPGRPAHISRRESTVMVLSIDKGTAGLHFDVMKFSDIVEPENVKTQERTQAVKDAFYMAENLLVSPAYWIDVEGTRYRFDDLYGELIKQWRNEARLGKPHEYLVHVRGVYKKKWPHDALKVHTPDTLDYEDEVDLAGKKIPIWATDRRGQPRFTLEVLESMYAKDPYIFSCQQLNNPLGTADGRIIFPINKTLPLRIKPDLYKKNVRIRERVLAIDTAETNALRSNHSALVIGEFDRQGRCWVTKIIRKKLLPTELLDQIMKLIKTHRFDRINIEKTAFVRGLNVSLQRELDLAGLEAPINLVENDNQLSKTERIEKILQPYYANGLLRFVDPETEDIEGWLAFEALLEEFKTFPRPVSDDILDALSHLFQDRDFYGVSRGPVNEEEFKTMAQKEWERLIGIDNSLPPRLPGVPYPLPV